MVNLCAEFLPMIELSLAHFLTILEKSMVSRRNLINMAIATLILACAASTYAMLAQGGTSLATLASFIFTLISVAILIGSTSSILSANKGILSGRDPQTTTFKSSAFDGSSVAMMSVDRDFNVTHVNKATEILLAEHEETFKETWPSFDASRIIGTNIDIFHKDPSHQRKLLADPDKLPYQTDISIGDLKFALNVSGVFDAKGDYLGNILEWDNVTAARMNAGALDALDRSQASIEFTLDGMIVNANQNFLDAVGYSLEEIVGQHHKMFVEESYAASGAYGQFWRDLASGQTQEGKFRRIGKDGREVWIQATYNPVLDGNGKPFKVVEFANDITELEKAARVSLFKGAGFDGSSVAMMLVDRDFNVTQVNESTIELLKENEAVFKEIWPSFNADDIIGSNIDMFHKNPAHQRQLLSDPSRLPYRTDITIGDFKFALNVAGVFDEAGDYVGNVLEWDDVTEARMHSGALQALDSSQATVEYKLDGQINAANEIFLAAMGYAADEIVGHKHNALIFDEEAESAEYARFWSDLARGEHKSGKFARRDKSGNTVWLDANYFPIKDANGNVFKVLELATDVTEIENERQKVEQDRERRATELSLVIDRLAEGLNSLSSGDFDTQIEQEFATAYEQLRADFNAAVGKLQQAETERVAAEQAQAFVVDNLAQGLGRLAEGNLLETLDEAFAEDYEKLREDFNHASVKLRETIGKISIAATGIRQGSAEISQSADELSDRTERQAATLEETSAAMEEITSTVSKTAEGANEANAAAERARQQAQDGGEVVRQAVDAMQKISESSTKIAKIIGVIDDIAFQTNLLALNAGVEAARAGDAGKGFSVVATEVRALAQRSSGAAQEIKDLIEASGQHVNTGVDLVARAGDALEEIVTGVENVSNQVSDITLAAQEQATALSEVNSAVSQLDQVTQQNAAMVGETTRSSHALASDADELMSQVSHFDIGDERRNREPSKTRDGYGNFLPDRRGASEAEPNSIRDQQKRAQDFASASNGSAALDVNADDWVEF